MGSTRGTAASVDRGIEQMMMRDHQPQSLTPAELDLEREPITRPPRAMPCRAWVRYGSMSVQLDAVVTAWTSRATAVKWQTTDGEEHRAWLWSGAVTPQE